MIEIKDLVVKYGDFTAIHQINLSINEGEFFTFLGPSGCGKTTTLRAIAGFEKPSNGSIVAFGEDLLKKLPEERDLGFVFQSYALFPTMNVYDNIAFGLKMHKVPKKDIEVRVNEIAEITGITQHLKKKVSELSGGQQQRIAVARALVLQPKILLMDEPLSNLDAKLRVSTREEIRKLQQKLGITTIYVTHDQEEAMAVSDRIAVFNTGIIEQIGTPKEVYNNPQSGFVARFIGEINILDGISEEETKKVVKKEDDEKYYIRPQNVVISKNKNLLGDVVFGAVVENFEFLGSYTKIEAKTSDNKLIYSLVFESDSEFEIGDSVTVAFRKKDVLVLREG